MSVNAEGAEKVGRCDSEAGSLSELTMEERKTTILRWFSEVGEEMQMSNENIWKAKINMRKKQMTITTPKSGIWASAQLKTYFEK